MDSTILVGGLAGAVGAMVVILLRQRRAERPSFDQPEHRTLAPDADPDTVIAHHLDRGEKIEAIKVYREHRGVGLKEAKQAIDRLAAERRRGA